MKPRKVLNKWQVVFTASSDFRQLRNGWKVADVGIFKLTSLPDDGMVPRSKRHYKGFWLRFLFWIPIDRY